MDYRMHEQCSQNTEKMDKKLNFLNYNLKLKVFITLKFRAGQLGRT